MNALPAIDVFLSRKSQDASLAKTLYDFLTAKGLKVFDSEYSLPELGNADYQRAIDQALDTCTHMIVVGSSVDNICSSWVDAEWRLFIGEKRAGYKAGNILTVVTPDIFIRSLPASLRYYEVIVLEQKNYERIYAYVRPPKPLSDPPTPPEPIDDEQPKPKFIVPGSVMNKKHSTSPATKPVRKKQKAVSQSIVPTAKPKTFEPVISNLVEAVVKPEKGVEVENTGETTTRSDKDSDQQREKINKLPSEVSHKTLIDSEYWNTLSDAWKAIFKKALNITSAPDNQQLTNLFRINKIVCSNSSIDTLEPLAVFNDLTYLSCSFTNVRSIKTIFKLPKLQYLNIRGLSISTPELNEFIALNPKCHIDR